MGAYQIYKQDGYIEGGGYLISWCVGHLVQLAEAAAYGEQYKKWSFESLPILPEEWQYAVDPDKGKQFKTNELPRSKLRGIEGCNLYI